MLPYVVWEAIPIFLKQIFILNKKPRPYFVRGIKFSSQKIKNIPRNWYHFPNHKDGDLARKIGQLHRLETYQKVLNEQKWAISSSAQKYK